MKNIKMRIPNSVLVEELGVELLVPLE